MKNYVSLVSILALTACATSGSGPDDRFRTASSSRYFAVGEDAAKSNQKVTSMDSEIIVCDEGGCPAHVNRYISNVSHHRSSSGGSLYTGSGFKVYGLDNVSFTTSDNPGTEKFKFIIEETEGSTTRGRITHISMDQSAILNRQNTQAGNTFANSSDNITLTYNSWADKKLRFSDFGEIKVNDGTEKDYVFAGGYEELKHDQPSTNMDFTGNAGGVVSDGTNTQNVNGVATLAFNDGTETLNMNFSGGNVPWYDVQIVKSDSGNTITFKNASNVNTNIKFDDFDENKTRTKAFDNDNMNVGYYGPGTNVSEATGVVKYTEDDIRMDAAFGVTKDNQ